MYTELTKNIYYVGVNDRRTELFENYWVLPHGIAYNSYLICGTKTAVVDTVECGHMNTFISSVTELLGTRKLDYIIINHVEPDHTGALSTLLLRYPEATIVGNACTLRFLNSYYNLKTATLCIQDGDTLSLGNFTLQFMLTPMLHWPETMVTYIKEEQILFSGDIFGSFGTLDGSIFDDQLPLFPEEEISRYYTNIVGKYGQQAQVALRKLSDVPLRMICSTHGMVWRSFIGEILEKYGRWSCYQSEPGVVIAFASMYGHTESMADYLAYCLMKEDIHKVVIHDTSKIHPSYILNDIFKYQGILLGSCTHNGGIHPAMETLLCELEQFMYKNHFVAFFGNRTWAGGAIPRFSIFAERVKWKIVAPHAEATGLATPKEAAACRYMASSLAEKIKAMNQEI